ncbi:MAG: hypothetical protein NZM43_13550 [Saprospiraceae bacterium]|nr:hypothetical protein [Saprospiraceae bacterium]MDW8485339.1 hypothetical protein [Saprospiraceae bacterium]
MWLCWVCSLRLLKPKVISVYCDLGMVLIEALSARFDTVQTVMVRLFLVSEARAFNLFDRNCIFFEGFPEPKQDEVLRLMV